MIHILLLYYNNNNIIIILGDLMIFQTFQKPINKLYPTSRFNKPLPSARNTPLIEVSLIEVSLDGTVEILWKRVFKSVIIRTYFLKYSYDFLIRYTCLYKHEQYEKNNPDGIIWKLIRTHLILLKAFLVLRFKKNSPIDKSTFAYDKKINAYCKKVKKNSLFPIASCYSDNNPCNSLSKKNQICVEYEETTLDSDNLNSVNLSSEKNESSQDNASLTKYQNQKNTSLIKYQNPEDVFAPYAHLWTYCENCETSIYKQYAQKNKYICKHCAFHLPMESSDRIESLIDWGTWDPTDENLVSIDPYEILRNNKIRKEEFEEFSNGEEFEGFPDSKEFEEVPYGEEFEELFPDKEEFDPDIEEFKKGEELEDLVNSLPSDEEELDPEGLDAEESTAEQTFAEESTAEQTFAEESTAEQTFAEESTAEQASAEQTFAEESTAEDSIEKKYTPKELVQLFLLEEIEAKAELEEKEKNFASADDEDPNQNSEDSTKSEESEENFASADDEDPNQNSEDSTKSEESEENFASADDEDPNQNSEDSTKSEESEEKDIPYVDKVDSNQRETGLTEAIQTGIGQLDGIPVALAVMDFQFIGGSMGSVVGEKITRLIEYATNQSLPVIISCASGGARMQEGSFSLMQMAKISSALLDYQLTNNLFLVSLLTSPTTGGVTASFGMLGNIIIGEPDAYIAFAGKRVIEEVMKIIVPEGVQEAEYLFEKGSLDLIVPRNLLKGVLSELLKFHGFFPLNKNENKI
uniref:acetyl-CoA carboxylase carboxyltransferase beta subunit n=1 Tax=Gahnia tristis TaxID=388572 RepID=UPI001F13D03D|nr:acetyl-CoA carboxylase carboxyltransferase beta subunit [Gahnia tristis]ULQ66048.1 acetyl-CoA carboxylase carboxyltransferase beta subunit [Gahnia tristis]